VRVIVNGFEVDAVVDPLLVDRVLTDAVIPLLDGPSSRHYVLLAAPPGVGKSTLAAVLEAAAREQGLDVQSIGLDGFHLPNAELDATTTLHEGKEIRLREIKGAPETFDPASLLDHLRRGRTTDLRWPVYDRLAHDVRPATKPLTAPVVLVEGNWLLLDDPAWREVADEGAYRIFIDARPEDLRERLISRKIRGGSSPEEATAFFASSDSPNITRALVGTDRKKVDLMLHLTPEGSLATGALS